jgi:plasmid stabilization system protein ParE
MEKQAVRLRITWRAEQQLEDAWDYVAKFNVTAANKLQQQLFEAINKLRYFPKMAPEHLGLPGCHRLVVGHYVVQYYYDESEGVRVDRVDHASSSAATLGDDSSTDEE